MTDNFIDDNILAEKETAPEEESAENKASVRVGKLVRKIISHVYGFFVLGFAEYSILSVMLSFPMSWVIVLFSLAQIYLCNRSYAVLSGSVRSIPYKVIFIIAAILAAVAFVLIFGYSKISLTFSN